MSSYVFSDKAFLESCVESCKFEKRIDMLNIYKHCRTMYSYANVKNVGESNKIIIIISSSIISIIIIRSVAPQKSEKKASIKMSLRLQQMARREKTLVKRETKLNGRNHSKYTTININEFNSAVKKTETIVLNG